MQRFKPYFALIRPVRNRFFIAVIAGAVAAGASGFGLPFFSQKIFPILFKGDPNETLAAKQELQNAFSFVGLTAPDESGLLLFACLLLPLVFTIRGLGSYLSNYNLNYCGLKVLEAIRLKIFIRLQSLSLSYHSKMSEGDLHSRVLSDTNFIQGVLVKIAADLLIQPLTLLAVFCFLIHAALRDSAAFIMLIAMVSIPLCILPIRYCGKKLVKRSKEVQSKIGDVSALVAENLATQREIRAYNLQQSEIDRLEREINSVLRSQMKVNKYSNLISPSIEILAAFGISLAIFFGAGYGMTLDLFIPLCLALYMAYEPVKKLGRVHGALKTGEAALDRIEEVLFSEEEILEKKNPLRLAKLNGHIQMKDVSFGYGGKEVLRNLNVEFKPNETIALVGPSGAGKSSFVSLIPRFYDVTKGFVLIDGHDVKVFEKNFLRSNIALVSQSPLLFRGSIADNIWIGRPSATMNEVKEAAIRANANDFILDYPEGYERQVGERGDLLSGGQRQRIAIARAFLRDAPILIFDEATSALDAESEALIQVALEKLSEGRTTFLIAHRFSSIRHANRILVFNNSGKGGEIIADGSHEEVYASCRIYKDLFDRQI
jgi:ATP-binding cassette, subfamily B, bacterial MsbA